VNFDVFYSPGAAPIAVVQDEMIWIGKHAEARTMSTTGVRFRDWATGVLDLELNPTVDEAVLSSLINSPEVSGLVLHAFPSGSIPEDLKGLADLAGELGKPVCFLSASGHDELRNSDYAATHMYGGSAFFFVPPMSRGAVVAKMSGAIGTVDRTMPNLEGVRRISEIRQLFMAPIAQEFLTDAQEMVTSLPEIGRN
jgi:L-asparaginase/Glu-tRNA(Gln) amidotransferase subunit D